MKRVNVAGFRAQLSHYLREIERGGQVVITDHKLPVAKLIPFAEPGPLRIETVKPRNPAALAKLRFSTVKGLRRDPVDLLVADRKKERNR